LQQRRHSQTQQRDLERPDPALASFQCCVDLRLTVAVAMEEGQRLAQPTEPPVIMRVCMVVLLVVGVPISRRTILASLPILVLMVIVIRMRVRLGVIMHAALVVCCVVIVRRMLMAIVGIRRVVVLVVAHSRQVAD